MRYFIFLFSIFLLLTVFGGCLPKGEKKAERGLKMSEKKVLMIIASSNFRDEEYQKPREILEKAGIKITVASSKLEETTGMLGMKVKPDILISEVNVSDFDGIVFVGGSGAIEYIENEIAHKIAKEAFEQNKIIGAICIAPVILAKAGILQGKKATCWASEGEKLVQEGAIYQKANVIQDGNIITASGPFAAEEFGQTLLKALE